MPANWLLYAFVAMMALAIADFMLGAMNKLIRPPISTFTLNLCAYFYMASLSLLLLAAGRGSFGKPNPFIADVGAGAEQIIEGKAFTWVIVPAVALCYLLGNRFLWKTYKTAPGIGLAESAGSLSSAVVLVLTVALFGVKFKAVNVTGLLISILGLALLSGRIYIPKY